MWISNKFFFIWIPECKKINHWVSVFLLFSERKLCKLEYVIQCEFMLLVEEYLECLVKHEVMMS